MIHVSFLETFTRLSLSGKGVNSFSFDFIDLNNISPVTHHESGCVNKREIEYIDRACIFAQYLFALIGRYVKQRETVSSPISIELSRVLIVFFFLLFFFFFFFPRTIIPDGYDRARFTAPCPFFHRKWNEFSPRCF